MSEIVISSGKREFVHPYGTVLRYFDIAPGNTEVFHQTLTIDFVICVQGRLELKLDSGESRIMESGDVVVQRATMHSWKNPSKTEWCRLVSVMTPAKEFMVGYNKIETDLGLYKKT
jgi:quercetin dioxygenase-like cupin family protein